MSEPPRAPGDPLFVRTYDSLHAGVFASAAELGAASARDFAEAVRELLVTRETIAAIFACAPSQLPFLQALRCRDDVEWARVHVLHMDEYLGMSDEHPASFRRFLREQLVDQVQPRSFEPLRGDAPDADHEIARYSRLIEDLDPTVCVMGIGENGHLAFNDPPADFDTGELVRAVELDEASRTQQWREGHFPTLDAVPTRALSLTIPALLRARHVFAVVPERRKAAAVRAALSGGVSPDCPASILSTVRGARLYLDVESAALLG